MTTKAQKGCYVIDHLIEALAGEAGSSLRRALILTDIDQHPGTTQTGIMERLSIHKSALTREIDWLFNYGCIMQKESATDARAKQLVICGYSKKALDSALDYFDGKHENLIFFLQEFTKFVKQERPTLRDAKIVATLYEKGEADKSEVLATMHNSSPSTDNRAFNKLLEDGVIEDG